MQHAPCNTILPCRYILSILHILDDQQDMSKALPHGPQTPWQAV